MINNRSYSRRRDFPHAFKRWAWASWSAQPTGGMVIGTPQRAADRRLFVPSAATPACGPTTNVNMDKQGVRPDVPIEITPEDWRKGTDTQLLKVVDVIAAAYCSFSIYCSYYMITNYVALGTERMGMWINLT